MISWKTMVMQYQSLRNRTEKENKMEKIPPPFTIIQFIQSKLSHALGYTIC